MTDTRSNARRSAMQALYQWQMTGHSTASIETQFLAEINARHVKIEDFKELLHGIPAEVTVIDAALSEFVDRSINSIDAVERAILRLGVYELLKRPQVPVSIIINEAINLAKIYGAEQSHKYVNSVLDKVARKHRSQEAKAAVPLQTTVAKPSFQNKKVKISVKSKTSGKAYTKESKKIAPSPAASQSTSNKYGQTAPKSNNKYKVKSQPED